MRTDAVCLIDKSYFFSSVPQPHGIQLENAYEGDRDDFLIS